MKKIALLSSLACAVVICTSAAMAQSSLSIGYAQGDFKHVFNKAAGFAITYDYEKISRSVGWTHTFTYLSKTQDDVTNDGFYDKMYDKSRYYSITSGPIYRLNDWCSIYGIIGFGESKFVYNAKDRNRKDFTDVSFSYGAGLKFNPLKNIILNFSYQRSRVNHCNLVYWMAGIGYTF